jgi:3-oxoacyl-[acyl-carrier protein] reductase
MDLELSGKTALITGGSKGIGLACAESLAAEGCNVRLAARTRADLEAASKHISARYPVSVAIHEADLSQPETTTELARRCGDVDILINSAGASLRRALIDSDDLEWRASWDLKVYGSINLTREIYRAMRTRRSGVIITIVGVAGEALNSSSIIASTGNAALMAFSRAVGAESVDHGVRVVAVNPGLVLTDRTKSLVEGASGPDAAAWGSLMQRLPFKRMAQPKEIGDVVAFLASARASYVSGTVITVDGGSVNRK